MFVSRHVCRFIMPMLFALAAGCAGEKEKPRLPDILLVTFDTTRADHLGCYGYVRDTSPRFDALTEQAILFERCIVPMAVTLPSHVSILTGTYPAEHGVKANTFRNERYYALPPSLQPFAVACREEGYETAAFVSAASLKRATGIDTGFDSFDQPETERRRAGATTDSALAWLERPREKPFFLWVHYFDPHQPVRPPKRFREMFRTDETLESLATERESPPPGDPYHAERREELLALLNGYDGEIRYMDEQFGRLVDAIDARTGGEETIILVVGDHGEGLYQHGVLEHGGSWEEQLRAPMLLRVPGEPPRRVAEPVSAVDAIPTLLGFVEGRFDRFRSQASGRNVFAPGAAAAPVTSRDTGLKEGRRGTVTPSPRSGGSTSPSEPKARRGKSCTTSTPIGTNSATSPGRTRSWSSSFAKSSSPSTANKRREAKGCALRWMNMGATTSTRQRWKN